MKKLPLAWIISAALTLLVGASGAALARGKAKETPRSTPRIFVFPVMVKGNPDAALIKTIDAFFIDAPPRTEQVNLVSGDNLARALGTDPRSITKRCRAQIPCIVQATLKAGADRLLLAQVNPVKSGVTIMFVTLDARTSETVRKVAVDVAETDVVNTTLRSSFYAIFGITTPGTIEISGAAPTENIDVDGVTVGQGPGRYQVTPGMHSIVAGNLATTSTVEPGATVTLVVPTAKQNTVAAASPEPSAAETTSKAAVTTATPATLPPANEATPAVGGNPAYIKWVAIALGCVAVGVLAKAVAFEMHARDISGSVGDDASETAIREAELDADRNRRYAIMTAAAGSVLAGGSVILGVSYVRGSKGPSTASRVVNPHPASEDVLISLRFPLP